MDTVHIPVHWFNIGTTPRPVLRPGIINSVADQGAALSPASHGFETMDFALTADQQNIRDAVLKHCAQFSAEYWLDRDREGVFPQDFFDSMAEAGWIGLSITSEYGGWGRGCPDERGRLQEPEWTGGGQ